MAFHMSLTELLRLNWKVDPRSIVYAPPGKPAFWRSETETFTELVARAIRENFMFIVLLVGGIIFGTTFTYCCCRCCSFCPLYQKRLHRKRMNSMKIGNRA